MSGRELALPGVAEPGRFSVILGGLRARLVLSLRWYLFALAVAAMLPLLTLAIVEAVDAIGARQEQAQVQMRLLFADSVQGVERGLDAIKAGANTLAASPALAAGNLAAFRQEADALATAQHVDVVLRDPAGLQLVATRVPPGAPLPTLPPPDRQATAVLNAGKPYVSDIYSSGMTHPFLARIIVPASLRTATGTEPGYSVEIGFTPQRIAGWINNLARPAGWGVCVIGRNGQLISHSGNADEFVGRGSAQDVFGPIDGFSGPWQAFDFAGNPVTGVYTRLPDGWALTVGAPDWLLARPLEKALVSFALVGALLLFGGTALALVIARRINHSVAALQAGARALGEGGAVPQPPPPIRDLAFVHAALRHAGQDIMTRQVVERGLLADVQSGRDLLQAVIEGSTDLIYARDNRGCLVLANQASTALLGLRTGRRILGRPLVELLDGNAASDSAILGASEGGGTASVGGHLFEVTHSTLRDAAGVPAGTISIAREVTDRIAADARLHRLQGDLARAGRLSAVAAMSAGLAHELHQPLSAAANFLAAAMRRLAAVQTYAPEAAGPVAEAMAEASAQVLRTGDIVQRLKGFIGQAEMQEELLAPLVREAAEAAWRHTGGEQAGQALRSLHFDLDGGAEALVDRVSIQQVVSNLVRNAAQAMEEAGGSVWVMVEAGADGSATISVLDSGPGIDPARVDQLFDVFSGSGKTGGLGVGLAICRTIVSAHGGFITAGNREEGGALFTFTLPPRPALHSKQAA